MAGANGATGDWLGWAVHRNRALPCGGDLSGPFLPQRAEASGPLRPLRKRRAGSVARTHENRHRRCRGVFAQSGAARRGRRPRARRLSQAARGRPRQQRPRRGDDRSLQDARARRGILAGRSAARRRAADPARPGLPRSVGVRRQAPHRRGDRAGRRACGQRQAFLRSGMVLEPVLRLPQAGLSPRHAVGQPAGQRRRRRSIRIPGRRPSSTCGRSPTRCRRRISC